jgi:hypothetical protein
MHGPKHPDRCHETAKESHQPEDESSIRADEAERQCQEEGQRRVAHDEAIAQIVSGRTLQRLYDRAIVGIRAVNELLSGSPIGDEIPLSGVVIVDDEDKNSDPRGRQAKSGNDAPRICFHWLAPILAPRAPQASYG